MNDRLRKHGNHAGDVETNHNWQRKFLYCFQRTIPINAKHCRLIACFITGCLLHSVVFANGSVACVSIQELPSALFQLGIRVSNISRLGDSPGSYRPTVANDKTANPKIELEQSTWDEQTELIRKLIAQLGDDHYATRDEAEVKLLEIGGPAIERLRAATSMRGSQTPDGEIQLRATRLLILIERKERERQIRLFLEGKDSNIELAGWQAFSEVVSPDRQTRRMFVDMFQAQPKLFAAIEQGKRELESVYQEVAKRSLRANSNANATKSVGTMNAMMFVAGLKFPMTNGPEFERIAVDQNDMRRLQAVMTQSQMVTYLSNCGIRPHVETLIKDWLGSIPNDNATSIGFQLAVIKAYELKPQIKLVIEFATDDKLPIQTRVNALETFLNVADVNQLDQLDSVLKDVTIVGSYLPQSRAQEPTGSSLEPDFRKNKPDESLQLMEVQLRDLALISAIKISGQDLAQYGFQPKCVARKRIIRNLAGFFSNKDRELAFEKWSSQNE